MARRAALSAAKAHTGGKLGPDELAQLGEMLSTAPLDKCTGQGGLNRESAPFIACFDDDCKKFGTCIGPLLVDGFGSSKSPAGGEADKTAAEPAAGSAAPVTP